MIMTMVMMANAEELKDHVRCAIGLAINCSKCEFLDECRRGYEAHVIGDPYRDKQLFKLVNPDID